MFSHSELIRYGRHIIMPEIGYRGQIDLKNSSVLVIGAGGLGCPALQYLTAAGVGCIGIIDFDVVEESNLQRQILYSTEDIGKNKAVVAAKKLSVLNPNVSFKVYTDKLTSNNALEILRNYNVIIDGSDNFPTRYLTNDACVILNKPLVFGALYKFEGQVSVFNYKNGPTYRCLFPEYPDASESLNCSEIGVLGVMAGIIGCFQACEAIKIITGAGNVLSGKLLLIYTLTMNITVMPFNKHKNLKPIEKLLDYDDLCKSNKPKNLVPSITANELQAELNNNKDIAIIDIRESVEFDEFHISESINIPFLQIEKNVEKIPRNKKVIIVCSYGMLSEQIVKFLINSYKYNNLLNLKSGITEWIKLATT